MRPCLLLRALVFLLVTVACGSARAEGVNASRRGFSVLGSLSASLANDFGWVAESCDTRAAHPVLSAVTIPTAAFSALPTSGTAPLSVQFTDLSTNSPTSWAWDFGDGGASTQQNPTHVYQEAGLFTVSLTASNEAGASTQVKRNYVAATFPDVPQDSWALPQILACVDAGIVAGYPDGTYHPGDPVTRDQMAVYIARGLAGGDAWVPTAPAVASFPDVLAGSWAYKYVEYAKAQGVVAGYPDGSYQPALEVTRDQMAVYIARAVARPMGEAGLANYAPPIVATFADVPPDFWAYPYVEYVAQGSRKVAQGYPDGMYHPEYPVTRDQMAVYIDRAFELEALSIRVQAIRVSDDDGSRQARTTPEQMQQWVDFANAAFAGARVQFEFDPVQDFADLHSTALNNVTGIQDANWLAAKRLGNDTAAGYPGKLVSFTRYGPGPNPTGGAFSWWDYNFVAMSGFADASHCGHPHTDAFAHEVGHNLGLPHTFVHDPFANIASAEAYFQANGDDPMVFDGDGFDDTLPDPGIGPLECAGDSEVVLDGVTFTLPRENLMSYYDERCTLSPLQVQRVRWVLAKRLAGQGALPVNTGAQSSLEAESLPATRQGEGWISVQQMDGFGEGNWSGSAQLFWGAGAGATLTLELPVAMAGQYRLDLYLTTAPDFGIVQVLLDGERVGKPFDAYSPIVLPSGPVTLGVVSLAAGTHELEFDVVGADAASTGHYLGIDCIDLVPG